MSEPSYRRYLRGGSFDFDRPVADYYRFLRALFGWPALEAWGYARNVYAHGRPA